MEKLSDNSKNVIESENEKKKNARKLSIIEGSFSSLMDGFGTRYISPYAISLGASNFQIGLLSSLPGLLGNLFQLVALFIMKFYSRKKIVIFSVLSQALLWLPLILIGYLYFINLIDSRVASNLLILVYCLLVIAGSFGSPAWNSWMKDILQDHIGKYFGVRNRVINIVVVFGLLTAGFILNLFQKEKAFTGFIIIFIIAFIGRAFAAYLFTRKYEPEFKYEDSSYFSIFQFVKKMGYNNFGRFVILVSLMNFATMIAGPFFAVYMLKDLGLNYIHYTLIVLSGVVSNIIFMGLWGRFSDKYGNVKLLKITGYMTVLIPLSWLITIPLVKLDSLYLLVGVLICLEAFSGFSWAGFNLSAANFIYDAVTRQRVSFCVAYFNIINSIGIFIGSLIGGLIISNFDVLFNLNIILVTFILSSIARFLVMAIISPLVKEVRTVPEFDLPTHLRSTIKENVKKVNVFRYLGLKTYFDS